MGDVYLNPIINNITIITFRFLYGRCLLQYHQGKYQHISVQIPLWAMFTALLNTLTPKTLGSDSSMGDVYVFALLFGSRY